VSTIQPAEPRFLGASDVVENATVGILGVPYDGAVTYRAGASRGPASLRAASQSIETYCPKQDQDLDDLRYVDLGDVILNADERDPESLVAQVGEQLRPFRELSLLGIGGDHLVALPFLRRALVRHPDLQILHIDAHWDLREHWQGEPLNHASIIRRTLESMGPKAKIHSWGIRSGLRSEYAYVQTEDRIALLSRDRFAVLQHVQGLLAADQPIYLTLDVDGIDPAVIPGTGTPEPDGLPFADVEALIGLLAAGITRGPGLVGADIVELAPNLDMSGRSNVAAARLVRGILLALAPRR